MEDRIIGDDQPNIRFAADFSITGDGVRIRRKNLALNEFVETRYRLQEEGPIDRLSFSGEIRDGALFGEIHTWDDEGRHLDLIKAEGLRVGGEEVAEVAINKGGKLLRLEVRLAFKAA